MNRFFSRWFLVIFSMGIGLVYPQPLLGPSVETLYGPATLTNPLIKTLVESPAFQRLKGIDYAGPNHYFRSLPPYRLFDHALGTLAILQRFNRPLKEQVSGLLEPIAHAAFAYHGAVIPWDPNAAQNFSSKPYHLVHQKAFLKETGLEASLRKYGISLDTLDPMQKHVPSVAPQPPALSALTLEKTLYLAHAYKLLNRQEINQILKDLRFDQNQWYFTTKKSALRVGRLSLYFAKKYWASAQDYIINRWVSLAIQRAIDLDLLTQNDIFFGIDQPILRRLLTIQDDIIQGLLMRCRQPLRFFTLVPHDSTNHYDEIFRPQSMAIDPLVQVDQERVLLSQIDKKFGHSLSKLQTYLTNGIKILYREKREPQSRGAQERTSNLFPGIFHVPPSDIKAG